MPDKTYTINGKQYIQRKLVLAQVLDLSDLFDDITIESFDAVGVLRAIGAKKLPRAFAIVLIPEGVDLENRDLDALEKEFSFTKMEYETALEVAEDFLSYNRLSFISKRIHWIMMRLMEEAINTLSKMTSGNSSKTSVEEILPSGAGSSGTLPLTKQ